MAALTKRPEEAKDLDTLVLDHVSDTTIINICNNPMDLSNAIKAFSGLKHFVLSIKRQEARDSRQASFTKNLWFLIRKAVNLESLCLIGWNVKRDIATRIHLHAVSPSVWNMRSLPFHLDDAQNTSRLRFLELKRVDVDPRSLLDLVTECATSLKELYLNEVYLKVRGDESAASSFLWIGHPDLRKSEDSYWIAQDLRKIEGLKLDVLRATGLGYDEFDPDTNALHPTYDLIDPSGRNRSFDQRFVEEVLGSNDIIMEDAPNSSSRPASRNSPSDLPHIDTIIPELTNLTSVLPPEHLDDITGPFFIDPAQPEQLTLPPLNHLRKQKEYDAETFQRFHNTTSHFKRCIDGYFFNHNEQALKELQNIITVADRGMTLLSAEIARARYGTEVLTTT
jgi:hypothetical protein